MKNPIKMDDLGGTPIFGNTHMNSDLGGGSILGGKKTCEFPGIFLFPELGLVG